MPSRPVLALVVAGFLLLPGPVYAGVVDSTTPDRVPDGYSAERVDLDDSDTRAELAEAFGDEVTVYLYHVDDSPPDRYRAPNRTADVLRRAYYENGSVRVTDEDVRADVTTLARNASFLRPDFDHEPRRLVLDRSQDALVVSTHSSSLSAVFEAVRDEAVVHYGSLSPAEQRTVDRVLNTTGEADDYYRPYTDEPHPEFPAIVEKRGRYFLVRSTVVVDDFGPDGSFVGVLATGLGVVSLLFGGALAFVESRGEA